MWGRISSYRAAESKGIVTGFDTMRYAFSVKEWRGPGAPEAGTDVEFLIDGMSAKDVTPRPEQEAPWDGALLPENEMSFIDAINACFEKPATFSGRARRAEYWYFVLFCLGAHLVVLAFDGIFFHNASTSGPISRLLSLALLVPWLAVLARRLHDTDRTAIWALVLYVVPLAAMLTPMISAYAGIILILPRIVYGGFVTALSLGIITLFAFTLLPGTPGPNRYGSDPLSSPADAF